MNHPLPPLTFHCHQAQTVRERSSSYKIHFVTHSRFLRTSKSYNWFKSNSNFAEGADFAYWWSYIGNCLRAASEAGLFSKGGKLHYESFVPLIFFLQIRKFHYILLYIWKSSSKTAARPTCCGLNCFSRAKESFRKCAKGLQKTESCPQFLYLLFHRNPVQTLREARIKHLTKQVRRICLYQGILNFSFFLSRGLFIIKSWNFWIELGNGQILSTKQKIALYITIYEFISPKDL